MLFYWRAGLKSSFVHNVCFNLIQMKDTSAPSFSRHPSCTEHCKCDMMPLLTMPDALHLILLNVDVQVSWSFWSFRYPGQSHCHLTSGSSLKIIIFSFFLEERIVGWLNEARENQVFNCVAPSCKWCCLTHPEYDSLQIALFKPWITRWQRLKSKK